MQNGDDVLDTNHDAVLREASKVAFALDNAVVVTNYVTIIIIICIGGRG